MIVRIIFLLLSLVVLVNLCITTVCYITGINLYKKYGRQMLIVAGVFVLFVAAFYVAMALFALR